MTSEEPATIWPRAAVGRSGADRDAETALVARVAARDEVALAELFDRFAPTLLAVSQRILGNAADAEEVLQEVFIHLWGRAASYDPGRSSVATWLVLVARSRAIDRLRSRQVAERALDFARAEGPPKFESPRAAANVLDHQRKARVGAALAQLPDEQRQVLDLAYYRGMTQSEIALRTGVPLGTVKTRTLLALRKLRETLRDEVDELL